MAFRLTAKQQNQLLLMGSDATHVMAYGGSRSGKTFGFVRAVIIRALMHESRHAILRYRFNHIKASVILDTLPGVMQACFPELDGQCRMDRTDWYLKLPNGSEIWFGGLDDKERTEKILGQEYATLYLNECSQIPWASRNMALTRLAQNTPLRLKAYYDCNPPGMAHWTYRLFIEKRDPERRSALPNPENYVALAMNPADNRENLPPAYLDELEGLGAAMRRRFLLGQFADHAETALFTPELLDQNRVLDGALPTMRRVVVAIDPSGVAGEEDIRSDEVGLVVVGLGADGRAYLIEDISGRMGPAQWGRAAIAAFDRHAADCIVAEENFGGAMVGEIVRSAAAEPGRAGRGPVPYRPVRASRGKAVRAEPVAALFEQGRAALAGHFPTLEDQLCGMTPAGYLGARSPDRADAMIWAMTALFPMLGRPEAGPGRGVTVNLGHAGLKRRR